ncbi:ABC transporter related protein [uncultured spirochete]|jgi:ABC-2 type transport system ATP-binding protein|uniref:ABC transporter related protein n=1 Tax=uncultured spirochete TaxID=156406 RepID=A0A3P3XM62_9SPIR|nr:ABC transporter related protein [uncultured spirochete]
MESVEKVIELAGVKKKFGERQALNGISLSVGRGNIFGYLGPNGAGKTTTIRILLDLLRADTGVVEVLGSPADHLETRRRIGFLLDADGLYDQLSAIENLEFYAALYGCKPRRQSIMKLLESVGLADRAEDRAGGYSKGMRRRLALARALVHDPELLILDEPMSGIDPSGQMELRAIIKNLVKERGKTILFSSHDLDEVERLCNRIALIDKGEIRVAGELGQLLGTGNQGRIIISTSVPVEPTLLSEMERRLWLKVNGSGPEGLELSLPADVVSFLAARGVGIEGVRAKHTSLEELYAGILKEREA